MDYDAWLDRQLYEYDRERELAEREAEEQEEDSECAGSFRGRWWRNSRRAFARMANCLCSRVGALRRKRTCATTK